MEGKIVIVDDDEDLMRLLTTSFKAKGFEVVGILTGTDAMKYLESDANVNSMSLLVLDRMLPDMDGMEILHFFIKKYDGKVPILILSTLSAEKDILEGLERGALDYVPKPFSIKILMHKALKLIENK